ncbi:superoxide dismutase [Candidatus Woesearchaeota archaeon]|nr:superoxide dismutase [Candidatus Woesearchaeota archaeon]
MHKVKALKFNPDKLNGISKKQITLHHDRHYASYVKGKNNIESALKKGKLEHIRELKKNESHNGSGMVLHETYFGHLGGKGGKPSGILMKKLKSDFDSYEKWKKEFLATASAGRGWALLCYDWSDNKLHNYAVDFHDEGAVWSAIPIMALDLWEHAYYIDYGPNKSKYIEAFFKNIDWPVVGKKLQECTSSVALKPRY